LESKGMFIATQLNSTDPVEQRTDQVSRVFVYDVTTYKLSQLGHYVYNLIGERCERVDNSTSS